MTLIDKSFQAKDLPALEEDAANVFSKSERILLDYATKRFKNSSELKELIQKVLHRPDFDLDSVDHDLHERLMKAVEDGDIENLRSLTCGRKVMETKMSHLSKE